MRTHGWLRLKEPDAASNKALGPVDAGIHLIGRGLGAIGLTTITLYLAFALKFLLQNLAEVHDAEKRALERILAIFGRHSRLERSESPFPSYPALPDWIWILISIAAAIYFSFKLYYWAQELIQQWQKVTICQWSESFWGFLSCVVTLIWALIATLAWILLFVMVLLVLFINITVLIEILFL